MTQPVVAFLQAHQDEHIAARAVSIIGGDDLTAEVEQAMGWLNDTYSPALSFRIGVVYGAVRSTGISLDTVMRILGDTDG